SPVFIFQAEDGIRDRNVTGVQTCALPISIDKSKKLPGLSVNGSICPLVSFGKSIPVLTPNPTWFKPLRNFWPASEISVGNDILGVYGEPAIFNAVLII